MRLLFDENLSPRLPELLADSFPGSTHVRSCGLTGAEDTRIWVHAREQGLSIVSKDGDFRQRSFLLGAPPKVIWLRVGNAGTRAIAELLRQERTRIDSFEWDEEASLLILSIVVSAV